jgi:diaminopropionate ammonia-lyase
MPGGLLRWSSRIDESALTQFVRWASHDGARNWVSAYTRGAARQFHSTMPDYRPTPLVELPALATELGVAAVLIKDESYRLGLPAFKILGASWAANCALSQCGHFDGPATSLGELRERIGSAPITLVTATDGNHGRALARMAALLGLAARIYVPAGTAEKTVQAIGSEGAKVVQTDLNYDDVVRAAASSTTGKPDEVLVQDTAWSGYEEIPQWIVEGYGTLFDEIDEQLGDRPVDLVAVPTGVGSLLQAALQHYRDPTLAQRPAVLAIEPVTVARVIASLAAGKPTSVDTPHQTIMAGLKCGTLSTIAWPAIRGGLDAAVAVTDDQAWAATQRMQELEILAGPCGGAALAGVREALSDASHRAALAITPDSLLVLISTEGAV